MSTPKRSSSMSSPIEEGRSPKRQRRSYSPASPPAADLNKSSVVQPLQTPPPSVHMSPEWQSQQLPGPGVVANSGSGSVTFPTPPSTAGLQSQLMAKGLSSEGDVQTPGYESEGQARSKMETDTGPPETNNEDNGSGEGDQSMAESADAENRWSNHERQDISTTRSSFPALPGARILYKVQTEPIAPSAPHPSQDLIQLYSLERLQSSVARRDPVTGAKINKLRKSYEGKVKDLGLDGRNKATKSEAILEGLADPGWDVEGADGKSLWEISDLSEPPLLGGDDGAAALSRIEGLLKSALDLRPGRLPATEHNAWRNLLGLDDISSTTATIPKAAAPAPAASSTVAPRTAASNLLAKAAPATAMRNSAPASPRTSTGSRPERVGKKRSYRDSSFEGYDGYEDDGYSTGGGDDGRRGSGAKRQKRKDFSPSSNSPAPFAGGSNSMVGIRSS